MDCLINPAFKNIDRLVVLSLKNGNADPTRDSLDKYYMSSVEIKYFNALRDNEPFFDQPVKKQEVYEKLITMSRNDDYSAGNLLDFSYHQNYYKLVGIDLSRKANTSISQKMNFVGKIEEDDGTPKFFYCGKAAKNYSKLFFKFINCKRKR